MEKQLTAKQAGGTEEEAATGPVAEEVNPARLAARQQRTQKLLAEAQAEGLLGSLDISSMPWTKVVVPKAVETAESLHKEAKWKYSSAWGRWKRCTLAVDEQRVLVASLEEQLEAARGVLLKHEDDFKNADSALSEAAKLVELAAAKQRQEMAEKTEVGGGTDEEMGAVPARKKAVAGAEEKALLASFQEELLADVRGGQGGPPTDEATQNFVAKCSSLFISLQKVVAEQKLKEAAAGAGRDAAPAVPSQPAVATEDRARQRTRSPHRVPRSRSLPPKEGDSL